MTSIEITPPDVVEEWTTTPPWIDDIDLCHIMPLGVRKGDPRPALCGFNGKRVPPRTHKDRYSGKAVCPECGRPTCPRCAQLIALEGALRR